MKTKTIKTKNYKILIEKFDSMTHLIETSNGRSFKFSGSHEETRTNIDGDFAGIDTWEGACKLVTNYNKNLDKVKNEVKKIDDKKTIQHKRTRAINDVAGYIPIIPNALMGLPKSMINSKMVTKKSKIINVVVDVTYQWSLSSEKVAEYYSKVLAYLISLEKQGFRVRISNYMMFGNSGSEQVHVATVLVKRENQPIDIKRLLFPITHTGTLRLFGFDWYERLPNAKYIGGYGRALHHWRDSDKEEILTAVGELNNKAYYLNYGCDYKAVFEGIK